MKNDIKQNELKYEDLDHVDKGIVDKVVRGGYSRRDALKLMVATGITMAAAENILVSGSVAHAATPKKGGSVRATVIHADGTKEIVETRGGRGAAPLCSVGRHVGNGCAGRGSGRPESGRQHERDQKRRERPGRHFRSNSPPGTAPRRHRDETW